MNRSPIGGKVACVTYKKGQFLVASKEDASAANDEGGHRGCGLPFSARADERDRKPLGIGKPDGYEAAEQSSSVLECRRDALTDAGNGGLHPLSCHDRLAAGPGTWKTREYPNIPHQNRMAAAAAPPPQATSGRGTFATNTVMRIMPPMSPMPLDFSSSRGDGMILGEHRQSFNIN